MDQSIGVFIGATIPTMVGSCKIEAHRIIGFDVCIPVKLSTIIGRDGFEFTRVTLQQSFQTFIQGSFGTIG